MKCIKITISTIIIVFSLFVLLLIINDIANNYAIDNKKFITFFSAITGVNAILTLEEKLFPPHKENKELKVLHEDLLTLHNDVDNLRKVIARQNQNTAPNKNRNKKKR